MAVDKQLTVERVKLAQLYPEGRTVFYEGEDIRQFIDELEKLGLDPTVSCYVPAGLLYDVQSKFTVGT
jgi:hypothetical protein